MYTPTKISIAHRHVMERQKRLLNPCNQGHTPVLFDLTGGGVSMFYVRCVMCDEEQNTFCDAREAVRHWNLTHQKG